MKKSEKKIWQRVLSGAGYGLSLVLLPILIVNVILIIEAKVKPDEIPGIFGVTPLAVVTDSMDPAIEAGDLILTEKVPAEELKVGDIIAYLSPPLGAKAVVTHRITAITRSEEGSLLFTTRGDANSEDDSRPVSAENLVGRFRRRVPKLGQAAIFMRTVPGMLLFVCLPTLLFASAEIIAAKREGRRHSEESAELLKELEELRAGRLGGEAPKKAES